MISSIILAYNLSKKAKKENGSKNYTKLGIYLEKYTVTISPVSLLTIIWYLRALLK